MCIRVDSCEGWRCVIPRLVSVVDAARKTMERRAKKKNGEITCPLGAVLIVLDGLCHRVVVEDIRLPGPAEFQIGIEDCGFEAPELDAAKGVIDSFLRGDMGGAWSRVRAVVGHLFITPQGGLVANVA